MTWAKCAPAFRSTTTEHLGGAIALVHTILPATLQTTRATLPENPRATGSSVYRGCSQIANTSSMRSHSDSVEASAQIEAYPRITIWD